MSRIKQQEGRKEVGVTVYVWKSGQVMFFHDLQVTALREINDSAANVPVCEAISKVLCFPKVFKLVYRLVKFNIGHWKQTK